MIRPANTVEARVLDAVDDAEMVHLLAEAVRIPSVTGTDAESDLQHWCARLLAETDLDVDVWKLDLSALKKADGFPGIEAPRTEGYGVVGVTEGEGVPALVLQGHVDVVPTGDLAKWEGHDPFTPRITGNVLHGRGACDMKAGLIANLAVVRALRRAGVRLSRPLAMHCVVSEEDGGLGAFGTLARGHTGEAAVITEPTGGKVISANAGALTFRIEVGGMAAHGATRHEGVSAIEVFWPVFEAIRKLEAERNTRLPALFEGNPLPYPIEIGTVRAGDWPSSVPDLLVAEGRMGVRLDEDPADTRISLEEAVMTIDHPWLRAYPPVVSWPGGQFASGRLPDGHPLLGEISRCVADATGVIPVEGAASYGSDLRLYAAAGIPSLHYGPGDVRFAHAPREQVWLPELREVVRVLALLAVRRCGAY
ncbi:ArgE/DapE family deacylase [Nonomuraea sp. NBC_00507]|uniref:ArgE/DapE family deacylase n=1 Tax=Nonomuraea sp. NBC_00507 TaxID=2976002 RepID=UPI002E19C7F1